MLGHQLVEQFEELGHAPARVHHDRVMVVGVGQERWYVHLGSLRRQGQTVDGGVRGLPVGTEEELPLGAPARDHVHPTRDDSTRPRRPFFGQTAASVRRNQRGCGPPRMVAGVAGEVPSGGTSSFLVVAAWVGIGANALQCGNGIVRVTEALQNSTTSSLQSWDDDSFYSNAFLLVDALGVFSGVASLPAAWRNFWAVISRQRAFVARGLSLEKLKGMNRLARFKVIKEVFEEAAKTPEGRTALRRAAAEAKVSAASFARETMSVRQSMTMVKVISKETQRRLINSLVGVLAPLTGAGASATPARWSGSASGSVNWVINLVDSG